MRRPRNGGDVDRSRGGRVQTPAPFFCRRKQPMWNPAGRVGPAVLSAALLACASGHTKQPNTDETPLPVNLEVQNDLSVPEPLTIYVQSLPGRPRMLGDMGPGTVKTFSFTPAQFGEPYRLIGYQQLMRPFTSAEFTIDGPETGTVIW